MTDKHTLVEQLRSRLPVPWSPIVHAPRWLIVEAATRITALEAEKAELVGALTLAISKAECWIHDQLDGTSLLDGALAQLTPARATLAKARQSDEGE